jgi:UDP-N-acetylmuramate dehydrogenase
MEPSTSTTPPSPADDRNAMARGTGAAMRGTLLLDEPMAAHTSWKAGGAAARFFRPADADDLSNFLADLPAQEPILWIGLGSNLLVRDGGFRGTVICVASALGGISVNEGGVVAVGAGVPCARVARVSAEHGLAGAEFLAGIPGTIGGALAMNAGAFGAETWGLVRAVETMDRCGRRTRRERSEFLVSYREVAVPAGEWFIAAELALDPDPEGLAAERIRALLARRTETQPTGAFSCGSVFRNPPGDFAGRLIESCGLKELRHGRARVSEKHANFIINEGGASAADIEALILEVKRVVEEKSGVKLEPEVRIVGERE